MKDALETGSVAKIWDQPGVDCSEQVHRCVAVVGRISGDDEDSVLVSDDVTELLALERFKRYVLENEGIEFTDDGKAIIPPGSESHYVFFINYVMTSDSPININVYH